MVVAPLGRSVILYSPGHTRTENSFYLNNNFCIYNYISLNCSEEEIVNMTSQSTDYGLSDGDTCQDYLWFDSSASGYPRRICGDEIKEFSDELHTHSFIGILWTNHDNSHGKYEILAQCTAIGCPGMSQVRSRVRVRVGVRVRGPGHPRTFTGNPYN